MKFHFGNELFDAQLLRTAGNACYGGADLSECLITAQGIRDGDAAGWYREWMQLADRIRADGERGLAAGQWVSAREAFLRASNYYRNAYIFLFGVTPDTELRRAYQLHRDCFRQAVALLEPAAQVIAIPYEGTTLAGYFLRAGSDSAAQPTVIANGGYDSTAEECYYWTAAAALRRGYNCLLFDGPGQGSSLIENGLPFRPDWEVVIRCVMDWLVAQAGVDPRRIAIAGTSFGGYLSLRGASGESRLAACVADPGQFSLFEMMQSRVPPFVGRALPDLRGWRGSLIRKMLYRKLDDPAGGWALRRGLWTHGAASLEDYVRETVRYSMSDRAAHIACPTLVCFAEDDEIAASARKLYDALVCPKEFLTFRRSEGAGEHCEAGTRLLFHQRTFAWLDRYLK